MNHGPSQPGQQGPGHVPERSGEAASSVSGELPTGGRGDIGGAPRPDRRSAADSGGYYGATDRDRHCVVAAQRRLGQNRQRADCRRPDAHQPAGSGGRDGDPRASRRIRAEGRSPGATGLDALPGGLGASEDAAGPDAGPSLGGQSSADRAATDHGDKHQRGPGTARRGTPEGFTGRSHVDATGGYRRGVYCHQ